MQKEVVDAVLRHLKGSGLKAYVDFPDVEFQDYAIIVTPVVMRDIPFKSLFDVKKDLDTALVSRIVSGGQVTVQIDVYAKTTLLRDTKADEIRRLLKNFPTPTVESPVRFLRISDSRTLDGPDYYRTTLDAEFEVYEVITDQVPLVQQITSSIEEV